MPCSIQRNEAADLIVGEKRLEGTLDIQGYTREHGLKSWFAPVAMEQHPDHVRGD
jgi:hypothetical protein